jgi:hypothetical protein
MDNLDEFLECEPVFTPRTNQSPVFTPRTNQSPNPTPTAEAIHPPIATATAYPLPATTRTPPIMGTPATRKSAPGTTTARKTTGKKRKTGQKGKGQGGNARIGARIEAVRKEIYNICTNKVQKAFLQTKPLPYKLKGVILEGTVKQGYIVSFDDFPC